MDYADASEGEAFEDTLTPEEEWAAINNALDINDSPQVLESADRLPSDAAHESAELAAESGSSILDLMVDAPLTSIVARDVTDLLSSFFFMIEPQPSVLLTRDDFTSGGSYDPINECIVHGDVAKDIEYIDAQTGPTCSLMAQEQFVERYIRQDIPEDVLAWRAETWGYYQPDGLDAGTNWLGQTSILEHFSIPHSREIFATVDELNASLRAGNDILIGVDARNFYEDPSLPPGSGHAVAVVGWGEDPKSGGICGYYITDSNFPGTVRFITGDSLQQAWYCDMVSVAPPAA